MRLSSTALAALVVAVTVIGGCTVPEVLGADPDGRATKGEGEGNEGEGEGGDEGEGEAAGDLDPGRACSCDDDCADGADTAGGHAGVCVLGLCMQTPSAACSSGGSRVECGEGFQCWGVDGVEGGFCWPDCDAFACDGTCDGDGSCAPSAATSSCDDTCSDTCGADGGGGGGGECPPNSSRGEDDGCYCDAGFVVVDNACVHPCETDGDCDAGLVCSDDFQCRAPPCTATSCDDGFVCGSAGVCLLDIGAPPPGPPAVCDDVPSFACTGGEANCGDVVPFLPAEGDGYSNYPLNGETAQNQYRSFARQDVLLLVKHAAASTACASAGWSFGNGAPLGLGDMSETNGDIPGTSDGSPGHPDGTHEDGRDMDIGYFQLVARDNRLREVCEHETGGVDQYHCVSEATDLDIWRTAHFIARLHDSPQLRVVGVDGKIGPLVEAAIEQLCDAGHVDGPACSGGLALAYETVDEGLGWFRFHHHHFHMSLLSRPEAGLPQVAPRGQRSLCLDEGCSVVVDAASDPRRRLLHGRGMSLVTVKRAP